jgi:hypothetical protein
MADILAYGRGRRTEFWKGITERPFHHSLGPIGPAVSEEIIFKWFFAEFSIFSNGGHLGWRPGSLDTILKEDHLKTIPP